MCRAPDEVAATAAASDHDGEMAAEMAQLDGPRQRTIRGRSRHDDRSGRPERIPTRSTSPQSGICAAGDLKIDRNHLRSHYRDKDLSSYLSSFSACDLATAPDAIPVTHRLAVRHLYVSMP